MPPKTAIKLTSKNYRQHRCNTLDEKKIRQFAKDTFGSKDTPDEYKNLHLYHRSPRSNKQLSHKTICQRLNWYHGSPRKTPDKSKLLRRPAGNREQTPYEKTIELLLLVVELAVLISENEKFPLAEFMSGVSEFNAWPDEDYEIIRQIIRIRYINLIKLYPKRDYPADFNDIPPSTPDKWDMLVHFMMKSPKLAEFHLDPKIVGEFLYALQPNTN